MVMLVRFNVLMSLLLAGLAVSASCAVGAPADHPAIGSSSACPATDPKYNGPCGPLLALPQWSDGSVWSEPSHYATIQTADIDGDGQAELLGRGVAGLYVNEWVTDAGQWVLVGGDPLADLSDAKGWTAPEYFETIQAADLDGDGAAELLARGQLGLYVYQWDATSQTFNQVGEPLAALSNQGFGEPQYYRTIRTGDLDGDGHAEVLARGKYGILVYSWSGGTWTQLADGDPAWSDSDGWDKPYVYRTIQTGDVTGDGADELLARGPDGFVGYAWDTTTKAFTALGGPPVMTDSYWEGEAYYSTIQTGDIDGDGSAELLARDQDGLAVWRWNSTNPGFEPVGTALAWMKDWGASASYYLTIQTADIDGNGSAELLGRGATGIVTFIWDEAQLKFLPDSPTEAPSLANDPYNRESLYGTIQTGDLDGNGSAELVVRGLYGMRAWSWNGTTWTKPAGGTYPPFADEQADAYTAISDVVGVAAAGGVRDTYNDPTNSLTNENYLNYRSLITPLCTGDLGTSPPSFTTCTPPPAYATIPVAAWTAVSNQLIAELTWAAGAQTHFGTLESAQKTLFTLDGTELPALADQFELQEVGERKAKVDYGDLYAYFIDAVGLVIGTFDGLDVAAAGIEVAADAMGAAVAGSGIPVDTTFEKKYAEVTSDVAKYQADQYDTTLFQASEAQVDYGLLQAVGRMQHEDVLKFDSVAMLSAGRQGFTKWVYQQFLPTYVEKYRVKDCIWNSLIDCTRPANSKWIEGGHAHKDFTALIDTIKSKCSQVYDGDFWVTVCDYYTPSGKLADLLFEPVSTACTYSPTTDGAWNYGCALGVDSSDLLDNRDGWSFKERKDCDPNCGNSDFETGSGGVLQARVSSTGAGRTSLSMHAVVPKDTDLDLGTTTATVEAVLAPSSGGELLLLDGTVTLPLELTEVSAHGRDGLTLTTPAGSGGPGAELQIVGAGNDPGLLLRLRIYGVRLGEVACSSGHTADLSSRIVLTDADGTVTGLNIVRPWDCRITGKRKNVRLSISPGR